MLTFQSANREWVCLWRQEYLCVEELLCFLGSVECVSWTVDGDGQSSWIKKGYRLSFHCVVWPSSGWMQLTTCWPTAQVGEDVYGGSFEEQVALASEYPQDLLLVSLVVEMYDHWLGPLSFLRFRCKGSARTIYYYGGVAQVFGAKHIRNELCD